MKLIDVNNQLQSTGNISKNSHKHDGEANMYVQFVYDPQTIWNHTQWQVSGSINTDPVNAKSKVKNKWFYDQN